MKTMAAISPLRICSSATWCGMKVFSALMPRRLKISGPEYAAAVPWVLKFTFLPARSCRLPISGRTKICSSDGKRLSRSAIRRRISVNPVLLKRVGIDDRRIDAAQIEQRAQIFGGAAGDDRPHMQIRAVIDDAG